MSDVKFTNNGNNVIVSITGYNDENLNLIESNFVEELTNLYEDFSGLTHLLFVFCNNNCVKDGLESFDHLVRYTIAISENRLKELCILTCRINYHD